MRFKDIGVERSMRNVIGKANDEFQAFKLTDRIDKY